MVICIDTETTGLDPRKDEILELAIADFDGNKLLYKRYRPTRNSTWPAAQAVHGIAPEDVKDCQAISEDAAEILSYLNAADAVIGYNVRYDLNMLWGAGIFCPDVKFIDVMLPFAKVYGEWNTRYGNYRWQKLTTAAAYYGYQWSGKAHGALADVLATLYVYRKLVEAGVDVPTAERANASVENVKAENTQTESIWVENTQTENTQVVNMKGGYVVMKRLNNLIPQIQAMLELEDFESFVLVINGIEDKRHVYRFAKGNLLATRNEDGCDDLAAASTALKGIVRGEYTVKKLPWTPSENSTFFYPVFGAKDGKIVACGSWVNTAWQQQLYKEGMVFRNSKGAERAYRHLTSQAQLITINEERQAAEQLDVVNIRLITADDVAGV